jgi:hypothetical protein
MSCQDIAAIIFIAYFGCALLGPVFIDLPAGRPTTTEE